MTEGVFFQDLAMLMSVAGLVAVVFGRLGWPKALGFILAGIVMNEHTWGGSFLVDVTSTKVFGQLGVVFLMLAMGLSFSAKDIRQIKSVALPCAVVDTAMMVWLGYVVGTRLFGWSVAPSLFLGVAICDSATTLLAKVIDEMGWGRRQFAKYVLGTSVFEDIICVGLIAVATGFAKGGNMSFGAFVGSLGWLAVFFLSILVFGLILIPRLLKSINSRGDGEALLLTLLGCCFLVSFFAYRFEFSLALGAFLVGVIGAMSEVKRRIEALVEPLKLMFSAVFFVSIGLLVDPRALFGCLPHVLVVSALIVAGKTANNFVAAVLCGLNLKTSVQHALSLAQIGEFAFMVAILYATLVGDAGTPLFQVAVGASLLTTLLNPLLIRMSDPIGDYVERQMPANVRRWLANYAAWLEKIRASKGKPAFVTLKANAIKLGVYAVLMLSFSAVCALLSRVDFSRFSMVFEKYDKYLFYGLANVFSFALLPLVIACSRAVGDAVAVLLAGDGESRWQVSLKQLVRFIALVAVVSLFFLEWAMVNLSMSPLPGYSEWVVFGVVVLVGISGWRFFVKAGRRATSRFFEAVTVEERREGLVQMMTVSVPEGTIHRLVLGSDSPAVGGTVVSLNIRAKTGASIVSVVRDGRISRNLGPEWTFCVGDELVALGEPNQIAALRELLGIA